MQPYDDVNCIVCGKPMPDWEPQMCCSGVECNCGGLPVDPPVCSENCLVILTGRTAREIRLETRYNELLMAVSKKHPGENRHETALRYIREAEATTDKPQGGAE